MTTPTLNDYLSAITRIDGGTGRGASVHDVKSAVWGARTGMTDTRLAIGELVASGSAEKVEGKGARFRPAAVPKPLRAFATAFDLPGYAPPVTEVHVELPANPLLSPESLEDAGFIGTAPTLGEVLREKLGDKLDAMARVRVPEPVDTTVAPTADDDDETVYCPGCGNSEDFGCPSNCPSQLSPSLGSEPWVDDEPEFTEAEIREHLPDVGGEHDETQTEGAPPGAGWPRHLEDRRCRTCASFGVPPGVEPCRTCASHPFVWPKWTPKPASRPEVIRAMFTSEDDSDPPVNPEDAPSVRPCPVTGGTCEIADTTCMDCVRGAAEESSPNGDPSIHWVFAASVIKRERHLRETREQRIAELRQAETDLRALADEARRLLEEIGW